MVDSDTRIETGYQNLSLVKPRKESIGSTEWREKSLRDRPLIKPKRIPDEILGDNYSIIKETLNSFAKSRSEWDEYAKKLDPALRAIMAKCFAECREDGFFGPHIGSDGEIKFTQTVVMRQGVHEVYRVEMPDAEGKTEIKRVAKEFLRPNMKIIERIR